MARPRLVGLSYMPHDTNPDDDEGFAYILAKYEALGYTTWFRLLERIYRGEGYFIRWTNRSSVINAKKFFTTAEQLDEIIATMVEEGLFDATIWAEKQILTSRGIQRRYFNGVLKRAEARFRSDLIVVGKEELIPPSWSNTTVIIEDENGREINTIRKGEFPIPETPEPEPEKPDSDSPSTHRTGQDIDIDMGQTDRDVGQSSEFRVWLQEYARGSPSIDRPDRWVAAVLKAGPSYASKAITWAELVALYHAGLKKREDERRRQKKNACPICGKPLKILGEIGFCDSCDNDGERKFKRDESGVWAELQREYDPSNGFSNSWARNEPTPVDRGFE